MENHIVWPNHIRELQWPSSGIEYSYEHRGYIEPKKVEQWLLKAFGASRAKYVVISPDFLDIPVSILLLHAGQSCLGIQVPYSSGSRCNVKPKFFAAFPF